MVTSPSVGLALIALVLLTNGCEGTAGSANHLFLFDALPGGISSHTAVPLDIRTNFSGSVQLVESRDFRVVVNITAASLQRAYDVSAELFNHRGAVVLEIREKKASETLIHMTALVVAILALTFIVGVFTLVKAIRWYKTECKQSDFPEHKSFASSSRHSQGGIYRSGNSIPLVALGHGLCDGDSRGDDHELTHNLRTDEELRQVKEMPEEEEAEERAMEHQLKKLKFKDDVDIPAETEDSDPQERNLIKSKLNSQAKTVHKDLIRKTSSSSKKPQPVKHTQEGMYVGIPTEQNEVSDDESDDDSENQCPSVIDLRANFEGKTNVEESSLGSFGKSLNKVPNVKKMEIEPVTDKLVEADVHKPRALGNSAWETPKRAGNIYVRPAQLKPVTLSTFGVDTSTPLKTSTPADSRYTSPSQNLPTKLHTDKNNLPHKLEGPWFTENFAEMADIEEESHEDRLSMVSDSVKSNSMYGSSEIFDGTENTYYNIDSDIEVPPLDAEDILSDGGIPSPLGFPGNLHRDKGKINDDIKLIPGALKSPGPNTPYLVKPRPNSSIILKGDRRGSGVRGTSESPPLPPPPEKDSSQSDTMFEFPPPPPGFYKPSSQFARKLKFDGGQNGGERMAGDYVQIKQTGDSVDQTSESRQTSGSQQTSGSNRRGGRKGFVAPTYMNLTILSSLCVLALTSGVLSTMSGDDTKVEVTVFAPRHFFTNNTRVFFNYDKDTEAFNTDKILVYDVNEPLIPSRSAALHHCGNTSCQQGCDELTGRCMCRKGYRLDSQHKCVDVNECMEAKFRCDRAAGCYNKKGSYDCMCGEDFYKFGHTCRECAQACPKNHFEVRPCSQDKPKFCEACTTVCPPGYYMAQPCEARKKDVCRECSAPCRDGEFELRQCTNLLRHDRECSNTSLLPPVETSKNVIFEDRKRVTDSLKKMEAVPAHYVGSSKYRLERGSGLYVTITLYFNDAAQRFVPVNLTDSFSSIHKLPDSLKSSVVSKFCHTPVPDYYVLRYKKHINQTYRQIENNSLEACDSRRNARYSLPSSDGSGGQSFLCSQPGSLSEAFKVKDDFFLARTKWVDKSRRCQRRSSLCESCMSNCSRNMGLHGDGDSCKVNEKDGDNGLSPRLRTCYNCCVKKECYELCKDYHKRRCQPQQCSKGNLLEFTMEPSWESSSRGTFLCPIRAQSEQPLLRLNYTVQHRQMAEPLYSGRLEVSGNQEWEETGKLELKDGVLSMTIDSNLGSLPNFLEGNIHSSSFKVGSYKTEGHKLENAAIYNDMALVMPVVLGQVPPLPQSRQDCQNLKLQEMNLASKMSSPYVPYPNIEAKATNNAAPFKITNKKSDPIVQAKLLKETAILQKMFPLASLVPGSFSGNVTQTGKHWVVTLTARVRSCPGYIHIQLKDPNYGSRSLFDLDIVVKCPSEFSLNFTLPTNDADGMFKDIVVVITDKDHVYNERVFRRSRLEDQLGASQQKVPEVDKSEEQGPIPVAVREKTMPNSPRPVPTPDLPLPIPVMLAIAGVVSVLLVLAILGTCFQPGLPETPYAKWYHPLFAMGYMMLQFLYSIVVSGSMFFLILTVLTSRHVTFILQSGQQGAVSTASSHIELLQLQRHLEAETSRQDGQLDTMQETCMDDVQLVVADLKKIHSELLNATEDVFDRYRLELLLVQQKLHVRDKLIKDLEKFRAQYTTAAQAVLRQVNQNVEAAFKNVEEKNIWLKGAFTIHGAVEWLRGTYSLDTKSFMNWTGIKANLTELKIDLKFPLPALPRLEDIPATPRDSPGIERLSDIQPKSEDEPLRTIQMHNNWLLPLEESGRRGGALFQSVNRKGGESELHKTSIAFYIFLALFGLCDFILIAHRLVKAWTTAKLIIYGFPEYFRERKEEEIKMSEANGDFHASKESATHLGVKPSCGQSSNFQVVKVFVTQTISTTFFPKIVFAVAACVTSVCLLRLGNHYLTVPELGRIGLYHSADEYVELQTLMTNARIQTHAQHINTVDLPAFQALISGHVTRHWEVVSLYQKHMYGLQKLSMDIYCQHLKALGLKSNCSEETLKRQSEKALDEISHFCKFYPVVPRPFNRVGEHQQPVSEVQVEALLESVRFVIYYCCQLMVIYLTIVVLKELACAVVWILVERSGAIRLRIIVEQDQDATL